MVVEKNANTNIMSNWRYFYWNLERYINEMGDVYKRQGIFHKQKESSTHCSKAWIAGNVLHS